VGRTCQRKGKVRFLDALNAHSKVLDVGCGEKWPLLSKLIRPDCYYVGIDIRDYDDPHLPGKAADEYLLAAPNAFHSRIEALSGEMDAVISSHNLEHCYDPERVLRAMCRALKQRGVLYLATPSEHSVGLPKRKGTLNFYDDSTHREVLKWDWVIRTITEEGLTIRFSAKRYRPALLALAGLILEPISILLRRSMPLGTTWALYGFEAVVWAEKGEPSSRGSSSSSAEHHGS
jgi:SAM-dependent methyltransferase